MVAFDNRTPHAITVLSEVGEMLMIIPPSGTVARVSISQELLTTLNVDGVQIPVFSTRYEEITGLPAARHGTYVITSSIVASATDREDVLAPSDLVRGKDGQPIGCRGFARPV